MRLYLDEDSNRSFLAQVLRQAGHDVQTPAEVGLAGAVDPVQLTQSIHDQRVFLSRNYQDFEVLHLLILRAQGHHPGILIVRRDNAKKRNLSPYDIVRAVRNLHAAGIALVDQYIILNAWQ